MNKNFTSYQSAFFCKSRVSTESQCLGSLPIFSGYWGGGGGGGCTLGTKQVPSALGRGGGIINFEIVEDLV